MNRSIAKKTIVVSIIMAGTLLISSCLGKTPPAAFYTLSSLPQEASSGSISKDIAIAIGPVSIPSELDRSEIITRGPENHIGIADYHRWVGPLHDRITSVMTTNLSTLLGTDRIAAREHENLFPFTHFIVFSIHQFDGRLQVDGRLQGEVTLDVTWSIRKRGSPDPIFVKRTVINQSVLSPNYNGLVSAQSMALSELSKQVAQTFRGIQNQ